MIEGSVSNLEAVTELEIGSHAQKLRLPAIIDTGYNGHLTLPQSIIRSLGLRAAGTLRGMLADGTFVSMNAFIAEIRWQNIFRKVVVTETVGSPLIGMALLEGSRITIDVTESGPITIESLQT